MTRSRRTRNPPKPLRFWAAVTLYTNGQEARAREEFRRVFAAEGRWVDLVPRLAKVGLFPNDPKKIADVTRLRPAKGPR